MLHTVTWDALVGYNSLNNDIQQMHTLLAQKIISGFEQVSQEAPLLKTEEELVKAYQHVVTVCGGGLSEELPLPMLQEIAAEKIEKRNQGIIATLQNSPEHTYKSLLN